ncbi:hypothetical protein ACFOEK_06615 [Litoribrevibacter euphylliae]|uniref:Uncharacterized protein n=1 Tax=Litoribrevibacter euphylliae TaxID=1834034 RepID=A0ABV7HDA5_9GAMM
MFLRMCAYLSLILSFVIPIQSYAGGKHSPLLVLISNKLKIEKLVTAAEENTEVCKTNTDQAWQLLKPSLHMLREYSQEKEGNYLNQETYANSLEQRAKMLHNFSELMDRVFHLKETC